MCRHHQSIVQRPSLHIATLVFWSLVVQGILCLQALAQNYAIEWSTIDGGGGTSTGGFYSVSGTTGQPDAGSAMTGGDYALQGGLWALVAVQVPGAPWLSIVAAGPGQARISWTPDTGTNWVLQESLSLMPAVWANSSTGFTNNVVVPVTPPTPTKYYRLHKS